MRALLRSHHFVVLLCLLLLVARISGAHWHLCLDGSEPPQSMHVGGDIDLHNADLHQADLHTGDLHTDVLQTGVLPTGVLQADVLHNNAATPHQDVDLKLVGEVLAKNLGNNLDAPMLLACFALLWLFQFSRHSLLFVPRRECLFIPRVFSPTAPPRAPPR